MQTKTLLTFAALAAAAAAAAAPSSQAAAKPGSPKSIRNMKEKIKTVVVMVMENRSFDNLMGGQTLAGLDNPIQTGPYCNPVNITTPKKGQACTQALDYDSVMDDPDHSMSGNNLEFYGTFNPDNALIQSGQLKPNMKGFVHEQRRLYGETGDDTSLETMVMNYYTENQVPVITALSQNFLVFNHWHSDLPTSTNPNRVAITSGTSAGKGANNFDYDSFDQMSIFEKVSELGLDWKDYLVDTSIQDARWYTWTYAANMTGNVVLMDSFYADAAAGTLPAFTYINPSCCDVGTNSMHPSGRISDGEQLIKDVYEALRAGPQWDEILWVLTFDETGGFHDHVDPPLAERPDNLTYVELTPAGENYTFSFDRLGGRLPTWLISPWVASAVEQQGLNSDGNTKSYHATSILRTLGYLWDFAPFNPRVEKAPSFDHLIQTTYRDCPVTLPNVVNFTSY